MSGWRGLCRFVRKWSGDGASEVGESRGLIFVGPPPLEAACSLVVTVVVGARNPGQR